MLVEDATAMLAVRAMDGKYFRALRSDFQPRGPASVSFMLRSTKKKAPLAKLA